MLFRSGNRLAYTSPVTGEIIKEFRKNFTNEHLDTMMSEYSKHAPKKEEKIDE